MANPPVFNLSHAVAVLLHEVSKEIQPKELRFETVVFIFLIHFYRYISHNFFFQ